jgi:phosphoserine phosphatase
MLTLVADRTAGPLTEGLVARVRAAIGADMPTVLSDREAVDLPCAQPPDATIVAAALEDAPVDAIATPAADRRKRLLIADMDSTIVTTETLDELAAEAGVQDAIVAITRSSMNGEIDFAEALRARVAMLKGLPLAALARTWAATRMTEGAGELVATMRAHGAVTALVSGGFTYFTGRVTALLGFDLHRANTLIDDGAVLTGAVGTPILDRHAKREELLRLARAHNLKMSQTLAVGDGANDLDMLQTAGLGVAFHAKPIVAQATRAQVRHGNLRALLFAQGYRADEFVTPSAPDQTRLQ